MTFAAEEASAPEGGEVEVAVRLDRAPEREVVVPITASPGGGLRADEYSGVPESVTFGAAERERGSR